MKPEPIEVWVTRDATARGDDAIDVWTTKPEKVFGDYISVDGDRPVLRVRPAACKFLFGFLPKPGTCHRMIWTPPQKAPKAKKKAKVKR